VQAVQVEARLGGRSGDLVPPTDAQLRDFEELERQVLTGDLMSEALGDAARDPGPGAEIDYEVALAASTNVSLGLVSFPRPSLAM
jgi:hypothetical protein